ncbi:hypothetical protein C1I95_26810 [Micromonospora craterilacus]|uniref:DUF4253 domain-containing protein n=1 Tax=Micromonospora craterilacus TaxID=1655439 RepID=A0A2W2DMX3_9ACTN|nr:DUF4253 domain-containing protein [Micromonospora craterilacus]PZG11973.1 hypothetical protein C1I95_26810 [Micromonospora craterilacus]
MSPNVLPVELLELFPDGDPGQRSLSVSLPPGRTVRGAEGAGERPALWVSDGPAPAGLWSQLHAVHQRSGLWPLLLDSYHGDAARPWDEGEVWPDDTSAPGQHDPERLLAGWWAGYTQTDEDDQLSGEERLAVTAPYGRDWPGLAAAVRPRVAPEQHADHWAEQLSQAQPAMRLGLVAVDRGSDVLAVAGWQGAVNYTGEPAERGAVLRSWEDRFGARVIGVGFAELYLSVAAPPSGTDEALRVAAEHFAFCPDNIWQGQRPCTLAGYADRLIDAPTWAFWWD